MANRLQRRRLAKYKRRKDSVFPRPHSTSFLKWSLRYHALRHRIHGRSKLWL